MESGADRAGAVLPRSLDLPAAFKKTPHILVVDDDHEIRQAIAAALVEYGFAVSCADSARAMDSILRTAMIDLILLDIMLPGEDGFTVCRRIRAASNIPIIMLTALGGETERVSGLEMGADDFISKPFSALELTARIRALLRRASYDKTSAQTQGRTLTFEGWRVDPVSRRLHNPRGWQVALTSVEFDLLLALCLNPNQVLSRTQLLELTHSGLAGPIERSVDVHVSHIRHKIETDPRRPELIKTVRLGGYIFTPEVQTE